MHVAEIRILHAFQRGEAIQPRRRRRVIRGHREQFRLALAVPQLLDDDRFGRLPAQRVEEIEQMNERLGELCRALVLQAFVAGFASQPEVSSKWFFEPERPPQNTGSGQTRTP